MKIESKTVHWGDRRKAGNFTPVTTPIYTAASYIYESMEQLDRVFALEESGPSYARYDNPTRSALEELVRELESGAGAIACASGMSAIHSAVLAALMDRPKRVLAANMMYGATTSMLMNVFGPMGVETTLVDPCDLAAFEAALAEAKPGAVIVETIANPLLRVPALDKIAALCRAAGVPLIVDNTFATPLLVRPLELGANIVVPQRHQISGRPRRRAGRRDRRRSGALSTRCGRCRRTIGPVMGPFESYLTMRGIKTLALRVERQCANACKVASVAGGAPARGANILSRRSQASRRRHHRASVPAESLRRPGLVRAEGRGTRGSLPLHGEAEDGGARDLAGRRAHA